MASILGWISRFFGRALLFGRPSLFPYEPPASYMDNSKPNRPLNLQHKPPVGIRDTSGHREDLRRNTMHPAVLVQIWGL